MDNTDIKILKLLQKNAQMTYKEIAEEINLTQTPVFDRIKRMEKSGVIDKYVTILNRKKVGNSLTVFNQVTMIKQTLEISQKFDEAVAKLPEVVECHFVSGGFDYLLKIIVPDMETYHKFHQLKLSVIPGVSLINSYFVMSEVKNTTEIPL
ncbi:Lrp/AsnC family transcriptional regulator [Arcticibacterium luteifluviistationis]|uniref:AsnC family transcriptional regulator n=1 Tax=Arcticibacterium luteifluviistationis TaxID=1784714 RepID=A0A2Z4G827_9BACT|nr:Lrp/AsnC family transcriptional regulator [Arcticibacterium luteifluviistationis]AWV97260.1 AsnC family transcriptional regulator [Arcticibacterium luteifluviistationis]